MFFWCELHAVQALLTGFFARDQMRCPARFIGLIHSRKSRADLFMRLLTGQIAFGYFCGDECRIPQGEAIQPSKHHINLAMQTIWLFGVY